MPLRLRRQYHLSAPPRRLIIRPQFCL